MNEDREAFTQRCSKLISYAHSVVKSSRYIPLVSILVLIIATVVIIKSSWDERIASFLSLYSTIEHGIINSPSMAYICVYV